MLIGKAPPSHAGDFKWPVELICENKLIAARRRCFGRARDHQRETKANQQYTDRIEMEDVKIALNLRL
jgi:hypothetical protein